MAYPHTVRIWRQEPGSHGPGDIYTPGAETVLYAGFGDCQDQGEQVRGRHDGTPVLDGDAVIYLATETLINSIRPEDRVRVTWEDTTTSEGVVRGVRRLDGAVTVAWL